MEKTLHKKFHSNRICGEWFDIKPDEAIAEISSHENHSINNEFKLAGKSGVSAIRHNKEFVELLNSGNLKNKQKIARDFGISRKTLYKHIRGLQKV